MPSSWAVALKHFGKAANGFENGGPGTLNALLAVMRQSSRWIPGD